jgi:O-antigen ligase
MNRFTKNNENGKRMLLPIAAYYFVLLLIALSWTDKSTLLPPMPQRILFTAFFALPLLKYRYIAPAVITTFATIRWFSVSPAGYLPSTPLFYGIIVLLILFSDIGYKKYAARRVFSLSKPSIGLIALLVIVISSNIANMVGQIDFIIFLLTAMMLRRLVRSREDIQLIEIAFMIITFVLSVYAFIFHNDFIVKENIRKAVIERAFWTDPNYLGSMLAIGIVISFFYFMNKVKDPMAYRVLYLLVFIAGCVTLGMLASRGAFFAVFVPVLFILYKKTNSIKNIVFVILLISIAFIVISSTNYFDSLGARIAEDDRTGSTRTVIWESSFNSFLRLNMPTLLIGGGTNYSYVLVGKSLGMAIFSPHNNFLGILYDYGILGLIVFLSIFYSWFNKNSHNVLVVSLIISFGIVCMTLVPTIDYPFCFLLILFECHGFNLEYRAVQKGILKYPKI